MRIVAGTHRSRILESPKDSAIRPTSDKVRGAIFNMLNSRRLVQDAIVIDGFCGTGALGLEALSQGARFCTFIDNNKNSLELTKRNMAVLKEEPRAQTIFSDVTKIKAHGGQPADLVFLDPPYGKNLIVPALQALVQQGWLSSSAHCVAEESQDFSVPENFSVLQQKEYGDTIITLLAYSQPL